MKSRNTFRIFVWGLEEKELRDLEWFIFLNGGSYYYLNPTHPRYPKEYMIVKVNKQDFEFPISPDYIYPITDKDHMYDIITDSIKLGGVHYV